MGFLERIADRIVDRIIDRVKEEIAMELLTPLLIAWEYQEREARDKVKSISPDLLSMWDEHVQSRSDALQDRLAEHFDAEWDDEKMKVVPLSD